jgi:hypothetical protein
MYYIRLVMAVFSIFLVSSGCTTLQKPSMPPLTPNKAIVMIRTYIDDGQVQHPMETTWKHRESKRHFYAKLSSFWPKFLRVRAKTMALQAYSIDPGTYDLQEIDCAVKGYYAKHLRHCATFTVAAGTVSYLGDLILNTSKSSIVDLSLKVEDVFEESQKFVQSQPSHTNIPLERNLIELSPELQSIQKIHQGALLDKLEES